MFKTHSIYICQQCGYHSSTYLGKCPQCDSWNSFVETIENSSARNSLTNKLASERRATVVNLANIQKVDYQRLNTGLEEFNRVLGGGIVLGSLILVAGDPGIGKSTLLTQLALNINSVGADLVSAHSERGRVQDPPLQIGSVLYVAGEESAQQIKIRVDRIKANANLAVLNETDVDVICEVIKETFRNTQKHSETRGSDTQNARNSDNPGLRLSGIPSPSESFRTGLVIVDSIQTLETQDLASVAGSVGQVRECTRRLQQLAKRLHLPIFLVGHVTKEGNLAGPKTLEHVVDVVLSLEGDSTSMFRILRSTKNRFGPTDEVGVFEMEEKGIVEVKNPSKIFLDQKINAPGSAVVATLTGVRPLLVEIQALVTKSNLPVPRRTGAGVDNNRLQLLVAVLQKRLGLGLYDQDIFVNVTGGLRLTEPAVDLGICLAIISSFKDKNIQDKTVLIGEVGLLGELRTVRQLDKRVSEAKKLGFANVVSPDNAKSLSQAMRLAFVDN